MTNPVVVEILKEIQTLQQTISHLLILLHLVLEQIIAQAGHPNASFT